MDPVTLGMAKADSKRKYRPRTGSWVVGPPLGSGQDDTPQIQAACDAARAAGYGDVVLQQNAVYLVNGLRPCGGPTDQKSVRLRSEGSLGYLLGTGTHQASTILRRRIGSTLPGMIVEGHGLELEGIAIDGNGITGAGVTMDILRGFEVRLRNGRIYNSPAGAARWLALSNPYFENFHVQTSGTDGLLAGTPGAAAAVRIEGNLDYEGVSNTVNINGLHLERNNGVDLILAPDDITGSYAEFVNIVGLHIESTIDNTAYPTHKLDPSVWIGNVRGLNLIHPYIYGGRGPLLYVNRKRNKGNSPMTGTTVVGGTLMGFQASSASDHLPTANTPDRLIDLVAGDGFAMYGTTLDTALTEFVRIGVGFGANVSLNGVRFVTRAGSTSVKVTDARTGYKLPVFPASIAGTSGDTPGGTVVTQAASGATRNTLDDGTGGMTAAGILAAVGGMRLINRTVTASGGLTLTDIGVVSTATTPITLTLPASSNSFIIVKNSGTAVLTVAAPTTGTSPNIDGAAFATILPGGSIVANGRSSTTGAWTVVASTVPPKGLNTIVWWGDSNTANGSNAGLSTRPGSFWPWANIILGHRLRTLKNAGIGGETSTQILARFDADVRAFAPAWVHILAGTNDAGDTAVAVPLATTQANILAMIDLCRSIGARVIIGTVPPRNTRTTASRAHAMGLNGWIRQLAYTQSDVVVVDYFGVLADPAVADNWIAGYSMDDSTHFRGPGACVAGKLLADTLKPLVPPVTRVSRVHAVDPSNLLTSQGLFQGAAAGTAPSGWTATQPTYITGLVDRTDGIPGKWLQVIVPDNGTFALSRNGDAAIAVGETGIFAVEFEATGLQAVATSGTQYLAAEFNVPSGIFPSELSHVSGASGDPIHGNIARSGVLETPPYTRQVADTQFRPMISIAGGGTYRFACGTVTKV